MKTRTEQNGQNTSNLVVVPSKLSATISTADVMGRSTQNHGHGHDMNALLSIRHKKNRISNETTTTTTTRTTNGIKNFGTTPAISMDDITKEKKTHFVVRHEPPKTYSQAPKPKKSSMLAAKSRSVLSSRPRTRITSSSASSASSSSSTTTSDGSFSSSLCSPIVHFDKVHVHRHDILLGCNPSVTVGPPIELSWDALSSEVHDLDAYEKKRWRHRIRRRIGTSISRRVGLFQCNNRRRRGGQRRQRRHHLVLSEAQRRKRLIRSGCTMDEINEFQFVQQSQKDAASSEDADTDDREHFDIDDYLLIGYMND